MLLHVVTGNISAVTLWPLATSLHCTGNRAYSLFYRLCSAIQFVFPTLDIFLVTMKHFYGRADVITFLFVPHLRGHSLQGNELYNTMERMDVLQWSWGQSTRTWLGWCFHRAVQLNNPPLSFKNYVSLLSSYHVNYVLPLRSWWSHVSSLPLIGTKSKNSASSIPMLIVSHIHAPICIA